MSFAPIWLKSNLSIEMAFQTITYINMVGVRGLELYFYESHVSYVEYL